MILLEEIEVGTSNSILQYLNDCVYCLILFGICRLEKYVLYSMLAVLVVFEGRSLMLKIADMFQP